MTDSTYHVTVIYRSADDLESVKGAARLIDNGLKFRRPRAYRVKPRADDPSRAEVIYHATVTDGDPPTREPLTLTDALDLRGRIERLPFPPTRIIVGETDPLTLEVTE